MYETIPQYVMRKIETQTVDELFPNRGFPVSVFVAGRKGPRGRWELDVLARPDVGCV